MKTLRKILAFTMAVSVALAMQSVVFAEGENKPAELFVSAEGNDSNEGTLESPYKTIEKARDRIREMKKSGQYPAGGVVVNIREGEYRITKTIAFDSQDSGTDDAPVVYRGYMNEKPVITGATKITKQLEDIKDPKVKKQLVASVASKVKQISLSEASELGEVTVQRYNMDGNPTAYAGPIWAELIINGEVMDMAKYPDGDEYLNAPSGSSQWKADGSETIELADGAANVFMGGNFNSAYVYIFEKAEISDGNVILTETSASTNPMNHIYQLYNAPSFISKPGEYYIDRKNKVAYVYPIEGQELNFEVTGIGDHIFTLDKADNITFRNLKITGGRMAGIQALDVDGIIVDGCEITNFPLAAVNLYPNKNSSVRNCHIYNIGKRAVNIRGGDEETLTSMNFTFFNNEIHKLGRIFAYQSSATWSHYSAVGATYSYNKIYDGEGQSFGGVGTLQTVEHNEIFDIMHKGEDQGMIYYGYNLYKGHGPVIRNNFFHDAVKTVNVTGHGVHGIYTDGGTASEIYNNVVANVGNKGIFSSASGQHRIYNNILIGKADGSSIGGICGQEGGVGKYTKEGYISGAYTLGGPVIVPSYIYESEIWKKTFPEFVEIFNTAEYPTAPCYKITNNVLYNFGDIDVPDEAYDNSFTEIKDNLITSKDPGFVDAKNGNYQLKENSEVYKKLKDFKPIDMSKIGLASDMVTKKLSGGLALKIGSPLAVSADKTVMVDKDNASATPVIIEGRTLMPVRFISENFGCEVGWDNDTRTVTVKKDGKTITMKIDEKQINADGNITEMDVPAQIIDGRTFIPLRALTEALGKEVFWDPQGLVVISDQNNFDSDLDKVEISVLLEKMNQY